MPDIDIIVCVLGNESANMDVCGTRLFAQCVSLV